MSHVLKSIQRGALAAAVIATAFVSLGCGKSVPVTDYPSFYSDSLKTVGVLDFRNRTGHARAGVLMGEAVTRALEANGTYRVLGPDEMRKLLTEPNAAPQPGETVGRWARRLNGQGRLDAVITGVVLAYEAGRYTVPGSTFGVGTGVGYGRYGYWDSGVYGYRRWPVTYRLEREAAVAVKLTVTRVDDGELLYAMGRPVRIHLDEDDVDDDVVAGEMLNLAADEAARELVKRIAPSPTTLKLKPDRTLRTARAFVDGEYEYTDTFTPGQTLYAVLSLPDQADRNTFRLAVIPKEGPTEIASREIIWDRAAEKRSVMFDVDDLLQSGGKGKYVLRLYAGETFVFGRGFRLRAGR